MGWLWSSSPSSSPGENATPAPAAEKTVRQQGSQLQNDAASAASTPRFGLTEAQRMRIFGRASPEQSSAPDADAKRTDAEMETFLKSLEADAPTKQSPSPPPAPVPEAQEPKAPIPIDRVRPDGSLDISLDVMYPRTMSCREAFDELWNCQLLAGKFNDVYRYGWFQPCNEQFNALTFCMRVRMQSDEHKQPQIRDFYAARQAAREAKWGSSQDVWDVRETAVEKAFWKDPSKES